MKKHMFFIITDLLSALLSAIFHTTLSTDIGICCRYCWPLFLCPDRSANQQIIIAIPRAMQLEKDTTKKDVHTGAFFKTENRRKWIKIGQFHTEDGSESKEHIITATNEKFWFYLSYLGPDQSTHSSCQVREVGLLMKNLVAFTPTAFLSNFFSVSPVHNLCVICLSLSQLWFSVCHLHWGDNERLFKKLVSMSLGVT